MADTTKNGMIVRGKVISTCHFSKLDLSVGDGISIRYCRECGAAIVRINPRTSVEEYLDGKSPWIRDDNLRRVE